MLHMIRHDASDYTAQQLLGSCSHHHAVTRKLQQDTWCRSRPCDCNACQHSLSIWTQAPETPTPVSARHAACKRMAANPEAA
jgi:hypothetical protein